MNIDKNAWEPLKTAIHNNQSFIISTHIHPDGDAIGSQMGLYFLLTKMGKSVTLLNCDPTPDNLRFLDAQNKIQIFDAAIHAGLISSVDALIVVDTNSYDRIGSVGAAAQKNPPKKIICIDHHLTETDFGDVRLINTKASSAGELIFLLVKELGLSLDLDLASSLYAAILTDTGSFRFSCMTSSIHEILAELLATGVRPHEIYEEIYEVTSVAAVRLLALILGTLELYEEGKLAVLTATQQMKDETGADAFEIEGLVNYTMKVRGVRVGILFKEEPDSVKVSLRSKDNYNVTKPAEKFGGGGHFHAAGIKMDMTLAESREKLLAECITLMRSVDKSL